MLERIIQGGRLRWRIGLAAVSLTATIMIIANVSSTTAEPQYPALHGETIVRGTSWEVRTEETDGHVAAGVVFTSTDRDSLLAYAEAVRTNGSAAFVSSDAIPALVTFYHPIALDRFPQMMANAGATVISYRIRTTEHEGRRGAIGGAPEPDGTVLDLDHVADFVERQEKNGSGALTVLGGVDAEVVIDRDAYAALSALDDEVFLVDVMRAVATTNLPDHVKGRVSMSAVRLEPLYWHLEDAGLTKSHQPSSYNRDVDRARPKRSTFSAS